MRQRVPIRPGDWVLGTLWLLVSAYGTGGLVNVQIDFEAQDGTVIVTEGFTQYNRVSPSGAWELYKLGAVAPMGAVNAVFQVFTASGASAGVLVNVDDAILNVV
jgi:hypothetical protein